jgi:hypothetical protein
MSATLQTSAIDRPQVVGPIIAAVVLALAIGAAAGSLITRAVVDRADTDVVVSAPVWDAQKLSAMEGRQVAAQVRSVPAWDAQKLAAMEGRLLAEQITPALGWDEAKLAAMEGRVLAGQVGD